MTMSATLQSLATHERLNREERASVALALDLIDGLQIDHTSPDGEGGWMVMGNVHARTLEGLGFALPYYPEDARHEAMMAEQAEENL
jgi:hypothetical protein